jgi:type II secretory pathway component PulF
MTAPPFNPYAAPEAPLPRPSPEVVEALGRRRWFLLHVALWLMIAGLLLGVAPRLLNIAADFGLPLSGPAAAVANASRWVQTHLAASLVGLVIILVVDDQLLRRTPGATRPWRLGFWLALPPLGLWLTMVWALFTTLASLDTMLSG